MFHFSKYTAFGNVYIVLDPNLKSNKHIKIPVKLTQEYCEIIQEICNIYFGIGSDGIIFGPILDHKEIEKNLENNNINSKKYDLDDYSFCRIFNPDGSEAEKSGNGTRIFAQYLIDNKYAKKNIFNLLTIGGEIKINIIDKKNKIIKSDIGVASFNLEKIGIDLTQFKKINKNFNKEEILQEDFTFKLENIPAERLKKLHGNQLLSSFQDFKFTINCVSVGNPHCIIILDEISEEICKKFGVFIENNAIFKNRINVQFIKVLNRNEVQIFIWERGAGHTLSSGTSSAAVASVCYKLNLCDKMIKIITQGGNIDLKIVDEKDVRENFIISIEGKTKLIEQGECFLS